jgi:hypothetical protein
MQSARADLRLQRLWVVHAGQDRYRLAPDADALPLRQLEEIAPLGTA